MLIMLIYIKIH